MKFIPLHDRVLVKCDEIETKSKGGIIILESEQEKPSIGTVVEVGPGIRNKDGKLQRLIVTEGDRIIFGKWSGIELTIDNIKVLLMKESDILGILQ